MSSGILGKDGIVFYKLFETMQDCMALHEIICDDSGIPIDYRFLEVNPAFEKITGLRREDILGKTVLDVLPQIESYWIETYGAVALEERAICFENYSRELDKYFQVTAFCPEKGKFATIFFDITEQKKKEQGLVERGVNSDKLAKQLRESQMLFEISQMLAGTIDLSVTLQQIADAANTLIKSASRTILHLLDDEGNVLQSVAVSGSDLPKMDRRMNFKWGEGIAGLALATGQAINVTDVLNDERYISVSEDKEETPRSLMVAPVRTGERSLGTLSVQSLIPGVFTTDDERLLTTLGAQAAVAIEKAKLYAELEASLQHEKATRAQLVQSEKLAALGRIVASVAHELNNPLQAIQNALYLVKLEESLSSQAREDLQTVLDEADRMTDLIDRLRETYRPTASEEFHLESLNLLLVEVQKLISTHLRHNEIELQFSPDENLPEVPMIRDQIKQVILNISLNAVEAMPEGGLMTIKTKAHAKNGGVSFSISDTGPSINPKILPYIFDPFVTTKEGGTGLGLAITYDIVRRHDGHIEVKSEPNEGTTFIVWLPGK
jgi:two-component system sensor histidine kinase HydH